MSTLRRRMMASVESTVPDNEIWYYAAEKVTLYTSEGVLSHEFANGKGVIVFADKVTIVGQALRGTAITDVDFPDGVTEIGDSAFQDCTSLALTELPSGVTAIRGSSFRECRSLALTELPSSVAIIRGNAFRNCNSIVSLTIPRLEPPAAGSTIFNLTTFPIYVPAESVDAYKSAENWTGYADRIFPIS